MTPLDLALWACALIVVCLAAIAVILVVVIFRAFIRSNSAVASKAQLGEDHTPKTVELTPPAGTQRYAVPDSDFVRIKRESELLLADVKANPEKYINELKKKGEA